MAKKRLICRNCRKRLAVYNRKNCRKCLAAFAESKRRARRRAGLKVHPKPGRPRIEET